MQVSRAAAPVPHPTPDQSTVCGSLGSFAVLCLAALVVGCSQERPGLPTEPASTTARMLQQPVQMSLASRASKERERVARGESYRGVEDEFVRIERDVPGFGGLFADSAGAIVVRLKDSSLRDASIAALRALSGRFRLPSQLTDALDGRAPMRVLAARYSMSELIALLRMIAQASEGASIVALDADERSNQVVVYVERSVDSLSLLDRYAAAGVAAGAVRFDVGQRPVALQPSLRGRHRPTASGLQIRDQTGNRCTLGWNVTTAFWNETGFLTAAHCAAGSAGSGSAQLGQQMYQPSVLAADLVGTISLNPAFEQTDPLCLGVSLCSLADAMFVLASNPSATWAKRVAKPTGVFSNNTVGSAAFSGFWTSLPLAPFAFIGLPVDKVGRTTGATRGQLEATCTNPLVSVPPATYRVLCADQVVNASAGQGDSGAPVLFPESPTQAQVLGMLFAGGPLNTLNSSDGTWRCANTTCRFYYSNWSQIELHLNRYILP